MWSQVSIEGRPRLLVVNACAEVGGDEAEFCRRLFGALRRRGVDVVGQGPLDVADAGAVLASADRPNCLFLLAEGGSAEESWAHLRQRVQKPLFLSVCSLGGADPQVAENVLAGGGVAPLAVVQEGSMTARAAGLYFLKLYTELSLHSEDSITGKMLWFSAAKARELLKRRRLEGKVGVRC